MFKLRQFALLFFSLFILGGCADGTVGDTNDQQEGFSAEAYFGLEAELLLREENTELYDTISSMMERLTELQYVIYAGWGSSDTLTEINGLKGYILVEYENVRSWADFEACLTEIYDEKCVEAMRAFCTEGEEPLFQNDKGGLYRRMADAPTNALRLDTMQIYRIKADEVALVCEEGSCGLDEGDKVYDVLYLKQNADKPYGYEVMSR